jgi:hypothetical protein
VLIAIGTVASNVERVEMKLDQLLGEMDSKFDNLGSKLASLEIKSSNHKWENEEQKMIICSQIDKVSSTIDMVVKKIDNMTEIVENDYPMTSRVGGEPGPFPNCRQILGDGAHSARRVLQAPVTQPGASPSAESSEGQAPIRLIV